MLYTCDRCGKTRADQQVDRQRSVAICPECGFERPVMLPPLFAVGGASGTGKTAVCKALAGKIPGVIVLDGDVLWDDKRYSSRDPGEFYENALRLAMNIGQSGTAAAIFHAGFGIPDNLENCTARRYFSKIHYLALFCSDDELEARLFRRPTVNGEAGRGFVNAMKGFNNFFRFYSAENTAYPPVDKLDTTGVSLEETAARTTEWIKSKI